MLKPIGDLPGKPVLVKIGLAALTIFFSSLMLASVSYEYDDLNRLTKATYTNGVEILYTYDSAGNMTARTIDASNLDTDMDGLPDEWEDANNLDPNDPNDAALDPDQDGLSTLEEYTLNPILDPNDPDTDNDGIGDALDNLPLVASNACSGATVSFNAVVTTDISCAATTSITVVPPSEVQSPGHLWLIAPEIVIENGFKSDDLNLVNSTPCPNC